MRTVPVLAVFLLGASAIAQQSVSFKLEEHTINSGGHPAAGTTLASTSYRVSLDSIGDAVAPTSSSSASYRLQPGFPSWFPPPGEVRDLRFVDLLNLEWKPERSIGSYRLYGGAVENLAVADYGSCLVKDIATETVAVPGGSPPSSFYLVTAANRLGEEGTSGFASGGERPDGVVCP